MNTARKALIENLVLSFKEIWHYNKRLILVLLLNVVVSAVLPFPNVILSGKIVDSISVGKDFNRVVFYVVLLFGADFALVTICKFLAKTKELMFIEFTNTLEKEVDQICMNIDFERFNDSAMQDRIMLINQAVRGKNVFTSLMTVFDIISNIITLIGIVIIMTSLNIWLLMVAIVIIALQAVLHYVRLWCDRIYRNDSVRDQRNIGYIAKITKDIQFKKDLITFDMSNYITDKIENFQKKMLVFEKKRIEIATIVELGIYFLSVVFQISTYVLIGIKAFNSEISIGEFTMGVTSVINFMAASSFVATNIVNLNDGMYYIKQYKLFQKFRSKYNEKADITINDIDLNNVEIEFRNVSFRYPNSVSYVLKNINLKIRNRERLAIVGYNGAGKTSLILLLTRMYDPTEGEILLNGIDIRRIDYRDYQRIISTVNQDFSLLAFSLLNNIALKDFVQADDKERILQLFKENGMSKRVDKLYRGLDTPVTKTLSASGVDLSGGECQRIAIIRALYKNSPILILDEPTSALDPNAEYEVYQKFAEMSEGKLTVFVSHRIYSTRFCDKIAVFDKGEIVEYGTYEELLQRKGLYYEFFMKQTNINMPTAL